MAIAGAQLIDGLGTTPIPSGTVLVDADGRIAAAGPSQTVPIPADAPILRVEGTTLLPGLIDGHVHITWDKTLYTAYSSQDYADPAPACGIRSASWCAPPTSPSSRWLPA